MFVIFEYEDTDLPRQEQNCIIYTDEDSLLVGRKVSNNNQQWNL
jgi:hypothetical protein